MFLTRIKKKAMIEAKIIKIVLLIFSFILIFGFLYKFYANITEHAGEEACRSSIILTQTLAEKVTAAGIDVGELAKPWPGNCKTEDKVSKADDTEEVKKELAELMAWCWWMMGEGVIKPFDKDWFVSENKCFVCYTVQFPKFKETIGKNDFTFYLREKGRKGMTYYDYFRYGNNPAMQSAVTDPIDNKRIYSVLYMSPNDPSFGAAASCTATATLIGAYVGAWPGAGIGAAIGTLVCGGALIAEIVNSYKEDVVYVSDVNRGMAGCQGNWAIGTGIETA